LGVLDNLEAISAIEGLSWRFADGEKSVRLGQSLPT
jgi:hypothetical protein